MPQIAMKMNSQLLLPRKTPNFVYSLDNDSGTCHVTNVMSMVDEYHELFDGSGSLSNSPYSGRRQATRQSNIVLFAELPI